VSEVLLVENVSEVLLVENVSEVLLVENVSEVLLVENVSCDYLKSGRVLRLSVEARALSYHFLANNKK
jgi:hypothetical protein